MVLSNMCQKKCNCFLDYVYWKQLSIPESVADRNKSGSELVRVDEAHRTFIKDVVHPMCYVKLRLLLWSHGCYCPVSG